MMRKLIVTTIVLLFSLGLMAQGGAVDARTLKLRKLMYGIGSGAVDSLIAPHADSAGQYSYKRMANPVDSLDGVNYRTLLSSGGGSMVYPGAGIALSTGSAWSASITNNSTQWNLNTTSRHNAVTLGTANGLSLVTQALSLGLSSTSTIGALSNTDWNIFNGKQDALTPSALTKVDDTNVTLTLGGSPTTSLLSATSITAGWTGTLADGRIASASTWNGKLTSPLTTLGDIMYFQTVPARLPIGTAGQILKVSAGLIPEWGDVSGTGTVTSVAQTVPTGFTVSGSPITGAGTLGIGFSAGYSLPTDASQTNWDAAYTAIHDPVTVGTPANGLSLSTQVMSLGLSSTSAIGALSNTDWNTFNGKEPSITAGTTAQYWRGDKSWQTLPIATGDVVGPASSTVNALARFDGGTGKLLQNSNVTLSNLGTMTFNGSTSDFKLSLDSDSYIYNSAGNASWDVASGYIQLRKFGGETMARFTPDGAVALYYNNVTKFATTSLGATIYGVGNIQTMVNGSGDFLTAPTGGGTISQRTPANVLSDIGAEPSITAGTTAQYWRGDKSWQTLPSGGTPAGLTNDVQYNNGGSFGAFTGVEYSSGNLMAKDNIYTIWGTSSDYKMWYDESSSDQLQLAGPGGWVRLYMSSTVTGLRSPDASAVLALTNSELTSNVSLDLTGTVDASAGFKDNGTAGIDDTFLIANGDEVTVSGGIITYVGPPVMPNQPGPHPVPSSIDDWRVGIDHTEYQIEYTYDYKQRRKTTKYYKKGLLVEAKPGSWKKNGLLSRLLLN